MCEPVETAQSLGDDTHAVVCTTLTEINTDRKIIWRINFRLQMQILGVFEN